MASLFAHYIVIVTTSLASALCLPSAAVAQMNGITPAAQRARASELTPDLTFSFDGGEDGPVEGGVWLPAPTADNLPAPLIVISHGNGGEYRGHADTARALADAGFIVAALTHPGDNYRDPSRSSQLTGRARQLSRLIDHMTGGSFATPTLAAVDADRIGAFGFSAGGFTVTTAIGGVSNLDIILSHCAARPDEFACRLLAFQPINPEAWEPSARDSRIRAAVIAAPALGYSFTTGSLGSISIPVQLWQAGDDQILPSPDHVEPIRDRLPHPAEYRLVQGAGHYDFLPPCSPALAAAAPIICTPTPGFDRAAFHDRFNHEVVSFFQEHLQAASEAPPAP